MIWICMPMQGLGVSEQLYLPRNSTSLVFWCKVYFCLKDIKYKTSTGKERRISKKSIENIYKFLLYRKEL